MNRFAVVLLLVPALAGCLNELDLGMGTPQNLSRPESLLWSAPSHVVVEIDYVEGRAPSELTLQRIEEELRARTNKESVTVLEPTRIEVGDTSSSRQWTYEDIRAAHETHYSSAEPYQDIVGDTVYIHYLFLNGIGANDDRGFVGVATTAPILAVLADQSAWMLFCVCGTPLGDLGPPHVAPDQAEASIAIHELGHAMGLVGRGAPETSDRRTSEDEDPCTCHSNDRDSVMYPGVEGINPQRFADSRDWVQHRFAQADIDDLEALRALDPYDK